MNKQQLEALQTYFEFMSMNGGVRIFHTAQQLGLFKAMASEPVGASDLAQLCGLQETPTKLLLAVLCRLKTVQKKGDRYTMTPVMKFLAGNYQNLSDNYWDYLPEYLQTGMPMIKMDDPAEGEKQYQQQVAALDWMMRPSAEIAATLLDVGGKLTGLNILDVGCGSGVWSFAMARRDPATQVTGLDKPLILDIAHKFAEQSDIASQFTGLPGDYRSIVLPTNAYDMVIVGNVTHLESASNNSALFKKLHSSLKQGGQLVVFDVFGDHEQGALQTALYALGLALRTENGQVHSEDELASFAAKAGFVDVQSRSINITPYTMGMLIGHK